MPKKLTHEDFTQRLKEKNEHFRNGKFEIVGEYVGSNDKIVVKNKYGECLVTPRSLLYQRSVPTIQTAIDKTQYFINQAREIHGDRYDYSKIEYVNSQTNVIIKCKGHGEFEQLANNHLQSKGCEKCRYTYNTFKKDDWCNLCNQNPGIFYILKCWNDNEEFYKIGITCQDSVEKRYCNNHKMPYRYEIVKEIIDIDKDRIWNLEKKYLSLLKDYHYTPKLKFKGHLKECFKIWNH